MNYRLTARAFRDLVRIVDFIGSRNPQAAARVASRIERTLGLVAAAPKLGRASGRPGAREFPVGPYPFLIVYRIEDGGITVLTIFHTARDPARK